MGSDIRSEKPFCMLDRRQRHTSFVEHLYQTFDQNLVDETPRRILCFVEYLSTSEIISISEFENERCLCVQICMLTPWVMDFDEVADLRHCVSPPRTEGIIKLITIVSLSFAISIILERDQPHLATFLLFGFRLDVLKAFGYMKVAYMRPGTVNFLA